jgi:hypothetical protein
VQLSETGLKDQLETILAGGSACDSAAAVGALTTLGRDEWAGHRAELGALSPANQVMKSVGVEETHALSDEFPAH